MLDLTSDELAQFAHIGWGYIFVTFPHIVFHANWIYTAITVCIVSGVKEYADCHGLEDTETSGGVSGSWLDFLMWCVGIALGVFAVTR